jgi:hypothetical protein
MVWVLGAFIFGYLVREWLIIKRKEEDELEDDQVW